MNYNTIQIIAALVMSKGFYFNSRREWVQGCHVIKFTDATGSYLCMIDATEDYYSINPLYICELDGKVHARRTSVGGTLDIRLNHGLEPAIREYNRYCLPACNHFIEFLMDLSNQSPVFGTKFFQKPVAARYA